MQVNNYLTTAWENPQAFTQIVRRLAPKDELEQEDNPGTLYCKFSQGERDGEFTIYDFRPGERSGEFVVVAGNVHPNSGTVREMIYRKKGHGLECVSSNPVRGSRQLSFC
jgi:hypothetical protein